MNLGRLLHPRSVAIVGATDRGDAYGAETLRNLAAFGFAGEVWGVNPGRSEALGVPCFPSLADLPGVPDAVAVAIPAAGVPPVIEQAGAIGAGGAVVFVLEDGIVYHTYSAYSRGLDGLWGMYQWLDRAPKGRNETGVWWRRHDEYDKR